MQLPYVDWSHGSLGCPDCTILWLFCICFVILVREAKYQKGNARLYFYTNKGLFDNEGNARRAVKSGSMAEKSSLLLPVFVHCMDTEWH